MLKTKIKISQVSNLTDARYFAAWGADYLGFCINPAHTSFLSPPQVKEIMDWVEGPQLVLEPAGVSDHIWIENYRQLLDEFYVESDNPSLNPDFVIINSFDQLAETDPETFVIFQSKESWTKLKESILHGISDSKNLVFLDIDFSVGDLEEILSSEVYGLVLRGGEEEKVGVKTFDDLDDIFDFLAD